MTHFLQSEHWQRFQEALGRTSITDEGDGWSYHAYLEKGKINSRLYVPRGPLLESPEALAPALASLRTAARTHNAALVRIEPTEHVSAESLRAAGLIRVARVQPEATHIVDLTPSEDEIIAHMNTTGRRLHRAFAKRGLTLHTSHDPEDITILTTMLHGVADTTGMTAHSDSYLRTQAETFLPSGVATLYYVTFEDAPIAAVMVFDHDGTRYYAHVASGYEHRNLGAGTSIVSHMMLEAKRAGLDNFDLYGIWPEAEPGTPHAGITAFKRSFGGTDIIYPGTWELPVHKLSYTAYSLLRRFIKERT